ncbi:MAG: DUF998 domain-containing protein [Methanobacterium sp. ERen5]|nr:MAG: DUF998 domain-containing protein [Methanobacterium sp. ERen5]
MGIIALIVFSVLTFISLSFYPESYSIAFNWLSNLGNVDLNPQGAIYFNMACIVTGIILIQFISQFYRWDTGNLVERILLAMAIILGIFASVSLIFAGVFPETNIQLHVLASRGVFEALFLSIILMTGAIFNHPKFMVSVALIGVMAVIIDLFFLTILSLPKYHDALATPHPTLPIPGLEWFAVFLSFIWLAALSYNMYKMRI